eukprot:CAMPEP_0178415712 /NCGR_PEP_ID=MMETSP0689_2-20121128/23691_1 /TAXON_ID=160604 /ORGANISM="Amphidinium massartii, Strain CS-259" /LENGTH=57 /DNA_ID=CAMNT_0020037037 /DNA_START=181 /DNA_END=354 /DNA_ORIENTATION=-
MKHKQQPVPGLRREPDRSLNCCSYPQVSCGCAAGAAGAASSLAPSLGPQNMPPYSGQ